MYPTVGEIAFEHPVFGRCFLLGIVVVTPKDRNASLHKFMIQKSCKSCALAIYYGVLQESRLACVLAGGHQKGLKEIADFELLLNLLNN